MKTENVTISFEQFISIVEVLLEPDFNSDLEKFWENLLMICANKLINTEHLQNWSVVFGKGYNLTHWKFFFGGNRYLLVTEVPSYNFKTRAISCSVSCEANSPLHSFLVGNISWEELKRKFRTIDVSRCYPV